MRDFHHSSEQQASCLCVGAANIDIRCSFFKPASDELSNPGVISTMAGGAALNTARILSACNVSTTLTGVVGKRETLLETALDDADVQNELVLIEGQETGRYISMLQPDGTLKIACNDMRIMENFDAAMVAGVVKRSGRPGYQAIFCDTNVTETVLNGIRDIVPGCLFCATTVSVVKAPRLRAVLDRVDVLFTNVAEAAALLGVDPATTSAQELLDRLIEKNTHRCVISNGNAPVLYFDGKNSGAIPVPPVTNIVDVTGAGDALAGGTLAALMQGEEFTAAINQGIAMAAKVLRVKGPWPG